MQLNRTRLLAGSGGVLVFGVVFSWFLFPIILRFVIGKLVNLKPGTDVREIWQKTPFPLHVYIYCFNITNPDEVLEGGKAYVQEIGPYVFDEWKDKIDVVDDVEEDTVSYDMRNTYIFNEKASNGLTGEEIINMPHPLIQGIAIAVQRDRPTMLDMIAKALDIMFAGQKAIISASFMDLFFRGISVDCSSQDFSVQALCTAFHTGDIKGSRPVNDTHFSFSFMNEVNHTSVGRFTACRGVKNVHKVGKVLTFNDEPEQDIWLGDYCNELIGTDSTVFPPLMTKEQGLWAFSPELCRSFGLDYHSTGKYHGMPVIKYYHDMGDIRADEKLHCFCDDPEDIDSCPLKGTMNLQPCLGGPLIATMPHFLNADESLFENVIGLTPDREKHAISVHFEIQSGSPFVAAKRVQYNMDMEPVEAIKPMNNVRKMILPMFWAEEGVALPKKYSNLVKHKLFLGHKFNKTVRWLSILSSLAGFGAAGYMFYTKQEFLDTAAKNKPAMETNNKVADVKTVAAPPITQVDLSNQRPDTDDKY